MDPYDYLDADYEEYLLREEKQLKSDESQAFYFVRNDGKLAKCWA